MDETFVWHIYKKNISPKNIVKNVFNDSKKEVLVSITF